LLVLAVAAVLEHRKQVLAAAAVVAVPRLSFG
jgi:hypothetical protein